MAEPCAGVGGVQHDGMRAFAWLLTVSMVSLSACGRDSARQSAPAPEAAESGAPTAPSSSPTALSVTLACSGTAERGSDDEQELARRIGNLREADSAEARRTLRMCLTRGVTAEARVLAAGALVQLKDAESVSDVRRLLHDTSSEMRPWQMQLLGAARALKSAEVVPDIDAALRWTTPTEVNVRTFEVATELLIDLGTPAAWQVIDRLMATPLPAARAAVAQGLGNRALKADAQLRLMRLLEDADGTVRSRACSVLLYEMGTFNPLKPGLFKQTPCFDNGDASRWPRVVERIKFGYGPDFKPANVQRFGPGPD